MNSSNQTDRLYYIDWLRVIGVIIVFCFHTLMLFVSWDWHINNSESSFIVDTFVRFIHLWIMPLFYVLAGASAHCSLRIRKVGDYIYERFKRLIVPIFGGIVILIPLQIYFIRLSTSEFNGSFIQFYPNFFRGLYPNGNFTLNHLWFIFYLFVISLVSLPLLHKMKRINPIKRISSKKAWMLILPLIPLIIAEVTLRYSWPLYLYPADVIIFFIYFVYGQLIASDNKISFAIKKHSNSALILGLVLFSFITVLYYLTKIPSPGSSWRYVVFQACWSMTGWFWVVAIMGFGLKYLNSRYRVLSYANEAVLPFYILHQTVILIIGYYTLQWEMSLIMKFLFIITTAFFITGLLLFVIWQSNFARLLFGLKTNSKADKLVLMNAQAQDPF